MQLLSTQDERQQQAACQMENNVHVGLVPKFVTEIQEDKGPFDQIGVMKWLSINQLTQSNIPRWHVEDVGTVSRV